MSHSLKRVRKRCITDRRARGLPAAARDGHHDLKTSIPVTSAPIAQNFVPIGSVGREADGGGMELSPEDVERITRLIATTRAVRAAAEQLQAWSAAEVAARRATLTPFIRR